MQHADALMAILMGLFATAILASLWRAKRGHIPYVRPIPGIASLEEAVGRATELGRPVIFAMGRTDIKQIWKSWPVSSITNSVVELTMPIS